MTTVAEGQHHYDHFMLISLSGLQNPVIGQKQQLSYSTTLPKSVCACGQAWIIYSRLIHGLLPQKDISLVVVVIIIV